MADPNYTDAFVNAYTRAYEQVPQEKRNPFDGKVTVVPITGLNMSFDDVGVSSGKEKTTRFAKRVAADKTHRRRWISPRYFYSDPNLVDKQDNIALHSDPTSAYMQSISAWVERQKRDVIIDAFDKPVVAGTNPGDDTAISFDNRTIVTASTGRTIPHDSTVAGAAGGVSTGLTEDKIVLAQEIFSDLGVPDGSTMYIACNIHQISDLRRNALLQSTDTSDIKALMNRNVRNLMGVEFVVTNGITIPTGTDYNDIDADTLVYECWCWIEGGIKYAPFMAPKFNVWRNPELVGEVWQIDCDFGVNAIRSHEDLVLKIECAKV